MREPDFMAIHPIDNKFHSNVNLMVVLEEKSGDRQSQ